MQYDYIEKNELGYCKIDIRKLEIYFNRLYNELFYLVDYYLKLVCNIFKGF